jgi:hypothetical protein
MTFRRVLFEVGTVDDRVPWVPLALAGTCVPLGLWSTYLVSSGASEFAVFVTLATWFFVLLTAFIASRGLANAQWCSAPVFMSLLGALEFVAVPLWRFITGTENFDRLYADAMFYVLIGYCMFWLACWLIRKSDSMVFVAKLPFDSTRVFIVAFLLFLIGCCCKVVLWELGIYGYLAYAAPQLGFDISTVGLLANASNLTTVATLISGIEVLGKNSKSNRFRALFACSLTIDLSFGVISGMKIFVIMPLFSLFLVTGITKRHLPRLIWMLPVGFIVLYPFMNAYRNNLNAGYSTQINTFGGQLAALTKSVKDVGEGNTGAGEALDEGLQNTGSRLSVLDLFRDVLQLPSPSMIEGDETIWLAPVYPFIPRFLWRDKPIFDKGRRMTEAMGNGTQSSTNVPGIADMYAINGTEGVLVGMFLWGLLLQLYMNRFGDGLSERGVFVYVSMLFAVTNIERDMVALIAGAVEYGIISLIISKSIYGGPFFSLDPALG